MKMSDKAQRIQLLHNINIGLCCLILMMLFGNFVHTELTTGINGLISPQPEQIIAYKIGAGDTLWAIAGRAVNPGEDVREKIISIRRLNGLTPNQVLLPGQVVQIPVKNIKDSDFRYTFKTP